MFRRWLFLGLTLALVAVIVSLVIQSRKQEARQPAAPPREVVLSSPLSATRVLHPGDLEVVECRIDRNGPVRKGDFESSEKAQAKLVLRIKNNGQYAYRNLMFRLSFFGRGNNILETKTLQDSQTVAPGKEISLQGSQPESVPTSATKCQATILYADLESTAEKGRGSVR